MERWGSGLVFPKCRFWVWASKACSTIVSRRSKQVHVPKKEIIFNNIFNYIHYFIHFKVFSFIHYQIWQKLVEFSGRKKSVRENLYFKSPTWPLEAGGEEWAHGREEVEPRQRGVPRLSG